MEATSAAGAAAGPRSGTYSSNAFCEVAGTVGDGSAPLPRRPEVPLSVSDDLLRPWPRAHLLQTAAWGRVQEAAGWRAHHLVVCPGGAEPLPLLVLESRGRHGLSLGPRLYVPKGPACAPDDAVTWRMVLEALDGLAERVGAVSVTVEAAGWESDRVAVGGRLEALGWASTTTVQPAHTAVVDLRGGDDAVLSRMRQKGRYNVRLAARRGVEVAAIPAGDPRAEAAAGILARLCAVTGARQGVQQPGASHIGAVLAAVPLSWVVLASVEGEHVAGALVAAYADTAIYLYGGSSEQHRDRQPSALLHAEAMRTAAAAGCTEYDLWGIPPTDDPAHAWHGLRQFKLSLGGEERAAAGAWRLIRRPVAARADDALRALRHRARGLRRSLPV